MSYEVLARKWRPLRFDDLVGQDHISRTLKRAVETERVSHAYLFSGPRGCGKTSTARILARVINCTNPSGGNPCNECPSCRAVIAGNNLDVMEIDGASHTGVSEVRDLQESIGYTPSQYRSKVYIIDEVHMLSTHAFNALLKTLEEPPPHVYFVFATTAPNKIPDTIKSRCQRHHFKRLEIAEIAGQLAAICEAEKVKHDEDGLRLLSRKADGSMRDGTSLLDQCITSSGGNITAESVRNILGLIDQEKVFAFIGTIASGEPGPVLRQLHDAINEGLDIQELCGALLEGYRDLMLLSAPGDLSDLLFLSRDEIELLKPHIERYEIGDLVTIVERLCNAIPRLRTAADPRIQLESLLVELSLLERQTDIRELIARLDGQPEGGARTPRAGESRRGGGPALTTAPRRTGSDISDEFSDADESDAARRSPAAQAARHAASVAPTTDLGANPARVPAELTLEKLQELWDGFVTYVRQKKLTLGVSLIAGRIYSFDGSRVVLRFARGLTLQREQVSKPTNLEFLATTFQKYFGVPAEVSCFAEGEERNVALEEKARLQKSPEENVGGVSEENKPVVRRILDDFDGEIIRKGN